MADMIISVPPFDGSPLLRENLSFLFCSHEKTKTIRGSGGCRIDATCVHRDGLDHYPRYSELILGVTVITLSSGDGTPLPAQGIGGGTNLMVNLGPASQFYNPISATAGGTASYLEGSREATDAMNSTWSSWLLL